MFFHKAEVACRQISTQLYLLHHVMEERSGANIWMYKSKLFLVQGQP